MNILYHRDNRAEYPRAEKTLDRLIAEVVKLGRAISGEHGIGWLGCSTSTAADS